MSEHPVSIEIVDERQITVSNGLGSATIELRNRYEREKLEDFLEGRR